ncbi:MAG TPA: hypothetical protein VFE17_02035, partial [Candidatus Baltobacteraceae bacterium]|nr:hypothetical protein [Candidatus Baltobacteraceae bacterium]
MDTWTWVLLALCALGLLFAVFSVIPVIRYAMRLRSRLRQLASSRLVTSLESLQMQSNRLTRSQRDLQILMRRCADVRSSFEEAIPQSGLPEMATAAQDASQEIHQ